jgi:hypothetical protein
MAGMICASCGFENEPGEFSCLECGAELHVEHATKVNVGQVAENKATATSIKPKQKCVYKKCGADIGPDDSECQTCGAPRDVALGLAAPGQREIEAWLITMDGEQIRVSRGEKILIGRALNAKLSTPLQSFMSVSRNHLWVTVSESGSEVLLKDADSANGSAVGTEALSEGAELTICSEVEIVLADQVSIRLGPA